MLNDKLQNSSESGLLKEEEKNIEETLYLSSIPGVVDDVNNIRKAENWECAKEFNPDEEW